MTMVYKIYFRNCFVCLNIIVRFISVLGVSIWENIQIRMNTSSVDATQSCEALLQNLNEDYQESFENW